MCMYSADNGHLTDFHLVHLGSFASRKASTLSPWNLKTRGQSEIAAEEHGGWPENVWGPSAIPFSPTYPKPKEMTIEEIEGLVDSFAVPDDLQARDAEHTSRRTESEAGRRTDLRE
jgi:hypothetical protein